MPSRPALPAQLRADIAARNSVAQAAEAVANQSTAEVAVQSPVQPQPLVGNPTDAQSDAVQPSPVEPMVVSSADPVLIAATGEMPDQSGDQVAILPQAAAATEPEVEPVDVVADDLPTPEADLQLSYLSEMPLVCALAAQLRQGDLAMLDDLHKRMGDEGRDAGADRRAWGRFVRAESRIRQAGTTAAQSSGHLDGFQVGHDFYADKGVKAGVYLGQLEGNMGVDGLVDSGAYQSAGFNHLQSRYLGAYGTWQDDAGFYADGVVQRAGYRGQLHTADGRQSRFKGDGWLASLEVGKAFAIGDQWEIEPQAQIIHRHIRLDDTSLGMATVQHKVENDWTLRLGMRIKASLDTSAGLFLPYGRINVYKGSRTADGARFITPVASTDIQTQGGYTTTELAAGCTLQLNQRTSLYGEVGHRWASAGDTRVKGGLQASAGLRVHW